MALSDLSIAHYRAQLSQLNIPATDWSIAYLLALTKYIRCPICFEEARIQDALLTCDKCHRGWPVEDLILKLPTKDGAAHTSAPASGARPTPEALLSGTPPVLKDPHSQSAGGVNSFDPSISTVNTGEGRMP